MLSSLVLVFAVAGCGGGSNQTSSQTPEPAPPAATPPPAATDTGTTAAATSPYDTGPRAGESAMNGGMASAGEKLFTAKGCAVCHGFGKKITCPDLVGVTMRRTATWMEHQILHPEVMVEQDPISKELRKGYPLAMTNQKLTPQEAKQVIEFLKKKDKQAGVAGMAS
jgi:mono/diheme cytochrome c family protein